MASTSSSSKSKRTQETNRSQPSTEKFYETGNYLSCSHKSFVINRTTKQSQKYSRAIIYGIFKIVGIKTHESDRPWFAALLHVITCLSAVTLLVTHSWYTVYNIRSVDTDLDIIGGTISIMICAIWCSFGYFSNELSYKLLIHPTVERDLRRNSKTIFKINMTLVCLLLMFAFVVINDVSTKDFLTDDKPCKLVHLNHLICKVSFVSRALYSLFFFLWNGLVLTIMISVCRTQTIGFDAFSFDPQRYAMDYHCLGFRECASEVARYLVTIEGMDVQDPLRLRLMSHLQCYSAQRELAVKSAAVVHNPWNSSSTGGSAPPPSNAFTSTPIGAPTHYQGSSTSQFHTPTSTYPNQFSSDHSSYHHLSATDSSFTSSLGASGMSSTTNPSGSSSIGQRLNSAGNMGSTTSTPSQYPSSFSSSFGSFASLSPTAYGNNSSGNNGLTPLTVPTITAPHAPVHPSSSTAPIQMGVNSGLSSSSSMRPYRPWGTELAY